MNRPQDVPDAQGMPAYAERTADVAGLQDELTGALIGLARAVSGNTPSPSTHRAMIEGLFTTVTNVNFNEETIRQQIENVAREKNRPYPRVRNLPAVLRQDGRL